MLGALLVGAAIVLVAAIVRAEPFPGPSDLLLSAAAGVAAVVGIFALYSGLAAGRMSVVAPVTGLLSATIPVVAGSVLEGIAGPVVLIGFAVAVAAIVLVSRTSYQERGENSGLRYAGVAGIGLGLFGVFISGVSDGLVAGPLVVVRLVEGAIVVGLVLITRRPWQVDRPLWPAVALVGVLDTGGNLFFVASIQVYRLDVAATLSSLYPVVTVVLAAVVLRERIVGAHALGIGLAAVAIVLITGGSTG